MAADFTTVANLKTYLRRESLETGDDALLARLVTTASDYFRVMSGWDQVPQMSRIDIKDGKGNNVVLLDYWPVVTVASVTVDGETLDSTTYAFTQHSVKRLTGVFRRGVANITVNYTAGMSSVPSDIEQAVIEIAALLYKQPAHLGQANSGGGIETAVSYLPFLPSSSYAATVIEAHRVPNL